jgi:hypothetical protein
VPGRHISPKSPSVGAPKRRPTVFLHDKESSRRNPRLPEAGRPTPERVSASNALLRRRDIPVLDKEFLEEKSSALLKLAAERDWLSPDGKLLTVDA